MIRVKNPEMNDTTRVFPRTLAQAFQSAPEWHDYRPEMDKEDYFVTVAGLAVLGFTLLVGWLR